ncbi:class I SAM-dependent methyltransferase [Paracoccaceae bacterium]|jgi:cyclopropane fatty-acyl-phospholipid synthase-like methyltransferase|nr:class I SAM-dependent methyltransferase [Paracoccaceae bacterium]
MKKDYWVKFWREHGAASNNSHPQKQVLRTFSKLPIDEKRWELTLGKVHQQMKMKEGHRFLDLCCGNGLFARHFSEYCARLLAVDISPDLLRNLQKLEQDGLEVLEADMRKVDFPENTFDRILCYAAVQYLDLAETVKLFERMAFWLEPGGILYIGDVPNHKRLWQFFDTEERQATYFRNIRDHEAIVGTWFEPEWLRRLGLYAGFSEVRIIDQPEYMIYHTFRYEAVLVR